MTIERVPQAASGRSFACLWIRLVLAVAVVIVSLAGIGTPAQAQRVGTEIRVVKGHSTVLRHDEKIQTVSLADDEIADVVAITADELVVIGKDVGNTTLIVWGESQVYTTHRITIDRNFSGQQILLEVQIGEVNRNSLDELGFDWSWQNFDDDFITDGDKHLGIFPGQTQTPNIPLNPSTQSTGYYRYVGDLNVISASIRAMQQEGLYKLRAAPKLLCLSGEEASFLAGGEIPVPVSVTGAAGIQQIGIEWKEYGVRLKFKPKIIDSTLINLKVMPEVSSLDFNNAILLSGFQIPALLTRRADATVELASGQGLLLGGLIVKEQVEQTQRIPILGHIPLLGALFTRKEASTQDNELIILVAPRLFTTTPESDLPDLPWDGKFEEPKDTTMSPRPRDQRMNPNGGMGVRPSDDDANTRVTNDVAPAEPMNVGTDVPTSPTVISPLGNDIIRESDPVGSMNDTEAQPQDTASAEFRLEQQPRKLWPPTIRPDTTSKTASEGGDDI